MGFFRRTSTSAVSFHALVSGGFILTCLFLFANVSRAPVSVQKLFPEGPSSCKTAVHFQCANCIPEPVQFPITLSTGSSWVFDPKRHDRDYSLTSDQCNVAFPGLFTEISRTAQRAKRRPVTREMLERSAKFKATMRGMIYDGELYIIGYTRPTVRGTRHMATLHALNRAILSSPEPLPDIEFAMSVDDFPPDLEQPIWSYTRKADYNSTWLMPDFGFWSWPNSGSAMGSWTQVRRRIQEVEQDAGSFSSKIPKLFWRGNIAVSKGLRQELVDLTRGKQWADVEGLVWSDKANLEENLVPIQDHCKYMFLMHTEGNSYSGRLKYIQNCRSLIFAHTMQWIQPFEYLMVSKGPKQNFVEVRRDFSDLEQKIRYYLAHKDEAERIASNSVQVFRDRYLTPAAEACYWRKLIYSWSQVGPTPEFYQGNISSRRWRGIPFENYALMQRSEFLARDMVNASLSRILEQVRGMSDEPNNEY